MAFPTAAPCEPQHRELLDSHVRVMCDVQTDTQRMRGSTHSWIRTYLPALDVFLPPFSHNNVLLLPVTIWHP